MRGLRRTTGQQSIQDNEQEPELCSWAASGLAFPSWFLFIYFPSETEPHYVTLAVLELMTSTQFWQQTSRSVGVRSLCTICPGLVSCLFLHQS